MRKRTLAFLVGLLAIASAALYGPVSRASVGCSVPFTFQNGTTADATQVNANFTAIITCLTNAAAAGINSDITQLVGLNTPLSPSLGGTTVFAGGTSTGTGNAQIVAITTPNSFALTNGYRATFIAGANNTAALTLNVHSTGALNVYRKTQLGATATVGGEVISGNPYTVVYDGSKFIIDSETYIVGQQFDFAGSAAFGRCLLTDGSAISRTTFADLYTVIGTTYGTGDGVTTFNIPDYRGRVAVMKDGASRITTACVSANTLGTGCGAQNQTIARANLPDYLLPDPGHSHPLAHSAVTFDLGGAGSVQGPGVIAYNVNAATASATTGVSLGGSGTPLPTIQPTLIAQKVICY